MFTNSKWDTLDPVSSAVPHISLRVDDDPDDGGGSKDDQARRLTMREIEEKIVQYQDQFEYAMRQVRVDWNFGEEIAHYRRSLPSEYVPRTIRPAGPVPPSTPAEAAQRA
uniref:(northern house mosquito) hypothetical protein n=1 Tax=Culex pipiens TaxID=7175 RepID=A0A8D8APJ2_CULPI